jgi:uncharacterized protein HemY
MDRSTGALLVVVGLAVVAVGLLAATGALSWLGRLPGDIRIDNGHTKVFIPITSMVIVSVVVTIIVNLVRRFL